MGTWAAGNFSNDTARDYIGGIADQVRAEMVVPEEVESVDLTMAAVDVMRVLYTHCNAPEPDIRELVALQNAVLKIYDEEIDGLDPGEEFKIQRREVIEKTFQDFIGVIKERNSWRDKK